MTIRTIFIYCRILALLLSVVFGLSALSDAASPNLTDPGKLRYPELQFNPPKAERIALKNGIIIYFLENNELPLVSINALLHSGTMYDPYGKEGVAELTVYLMRTGGTQKLSSHEVDNRLDFMAASPSITAGLDSVQINFSLLDKDIDQGFDLLSQMLIIPAFEQNKLDLAKRLKTEEIRRLKDDPQKLAFREFNRMIYSGNPRSRSVSLQSLADIDREDLIKFHKQFFRPQNVMFALTGNISRNVAINKINQYFGSWELSGNPVLIPSPPQSSKAGVFYINKEIPQSTVIRGKLSPGKNDPDFHAFTVLDFILGSGGFPSRIFSAVRNNEGLAYSAGSFYRARADHGIFAAYAFTKTASTIQTLSLIDSVLDNTKINPFTQSEIEWAKKSINNGFIFSFASPEQITWQQMKREYDMLPENFLSTYCSKIETIQLADLNRIALKYLNKENTVTMILGESNKFIRELTGKNGRPISIAPEY